MKSLFSFFSKVLKKFWFNKSTPSCIRGAAISGCVKTQVVRGAVMKGTGIELSVAIPMFRAKYIGWLPLEGLIRQKNINFKWELVIMEELKDETFGEKNIRAYEERLKKVGCVRVLYKGLKNWIPLSNKWVGLANMCDTHSRIFVPHAADNYSSPLRLSRHYEVFKNDKVHMHIPTKAIYYNISTGKTILHDTSLVGRKDDCAARAMTTDAVRRLPKIGKRAGVDGWLRVAVRDVIGKGVFKIFFDKENNNWKSGLNTYGLNIIMNRKEFKTLKPPFTKCPIKIENNIPKDVLVRLNKCKELVKNHKRGFPKGPNKK